MTKQEYNRLRLERDNIIRANKGRRMMRPPQPPLVVPPKPIPPLVPVAYEADGTYAGRLNDVDECPPGCVIKWEAAF